MQAGTPEAYRLLECLEERHEQRTRKDAPPHLSMIGGFDVHPTLASRAPPRADGDEVSDDSSSRSIYSAAAAREDAQPGRAVGGTAPSVRVSRHGSISISPNRASALPTAAVQRPLHGISAATKNALAAIDGGSPQLGAHRALTSPPPTSAPRASPTLVARAAPRLVVVEPGTFATPKPTSSYLPPSPPARGVGVAATPPRRPPLASTASTRVATPAPWSRYTPTAAYDALGGATSPRTSVAANKTTRPIAVNRHGSVSIGHEPFSNRRGERYEGAPRTSAAARPSKSFLDNLLA